MILDQPRSIQAADLFCGAGGTSLGLAKACEAAGATVDLVAVNHWPKAVATHELNHPWARHYCAALDSLDPRKVVPGRRLDVIVAGVECTHHSRARGGRPLSDQSRASAWHVLHWIEQLQVDNVLIENVPEFQNWGPLGTDGRPIRDRRGDTFRAFVQALESLDYRVEWQVLNAADYGDPTLRRRFFLRARAHRQAIEWPRTSHTEEATAKTRAWRTAREIIDWSDLGNSIFRRKRPLAKRTVARIQAGIERFCGEYAKSFLLTLTHGGRVRSLDQPMPTVTGANRGEMALASPFLLPHDQFTARNGLSLVDPVTRPLRTITASNGGCNYLVSPFIVPHFGERPGQAPRTHSVDAPAPAVTATKGAGSLCTPFVVPYYGNSGPHDVDEPLRTVTTRDRFALVTPDGLALDIFFRMLQPRELARAQGFPDSFRFAGNKGEVIRQIGNAVPVGIASAICGSILERTA